MTKIAEVPSSTRVAFPSSTELSYNADWGLEQMKRTTLTGAMCLSFMVSGCSLIVNPELPTEVEIDLAKFGARCAVASECGVGLLCESRRCTVACSSGKPCPTGGVAATCSAGAMCEFSSPPPIADLQVGMLYIGPLGDHGWTQTHEDSRLFFTDAIPGTVSNGEPLVDPADAEAKMNEFIARGDNVIIGTSFDFTVPVQSVAANNPDVNFLLCSGFKSAPNLGSYFGRMYQVMYMAGVLAGLRTQTNNIGIVGPVIIPETVRHTNAFTLGVQSVNPTATVFIEWVGAWFSPPEEIAATNKLIDQADVDIVFGFTDTVIPLQTACMEVNDVCTRTSSSGATVFSLGYDNQDSCTFAPDRCLASAYWNWGPLVTRILNDMKAGKWDAAELPWDQLNGTPADSVAHLQINETLVLGSEQIQVETVGGQMTANTEEARMLPFSGGVNDATGQERFARDTLPTDDDLLRMCWLVEGVKHVDGSEGTAPGCVGDQ